jgi:hypothetical protein
MRSFIYLILFSGIFFQYASSNYILCTSRCSQVTVSFRNPLEIPVECQESDNIPTIYEDALFCKIVYRIDYDAKSIYITLNANNDTSIFKAHNQSELLIQTVWLGFKQDSKEPNITQRTYVCNTENDCARQFYLNTIQHLITNGKSLLDKIHSKLYKRPLSTGPLTYHRCKDSTKIYNKSLVLCKKGLCSADTINAKQHCTSDNTATLFSEFEYHSPQSIINEREAIEYKCNINLCNSNVTIAKIKKLLQDYTNWKGEYQIEEKSSTIRRTLSYCLIILCLFVLRLLF